VEDPLFRIANLIDAIEGIRTRVDAAMKVWPEISRTVKPALDQVDQIISDLKALKEALSLLWQHGFEVNWKKE
jgi:hypothetical protein